LTTTTTTTTPNIQSPSEDFLRANYGDNTGFVSEMFSLFQQPSDFIASIATATAQLFNIGSGDSSTNAINRPNNIEEPPALLENTSTTTTSTHFPREHWICNYPDCLNDYRCPCDNSSHTWCRVNDAHYCEEHINCHEDYILSGQQEMSTTTTTTITPNIQPLSEDFLTTTTTTTTPNIQSPIFMIIMNGF
jgi:hypothetical protein